MSEGLAVWPTLFLLGAYHGINPGMGWLFAVARGMQEHRTRAVAWSLPPIALGHALSIGVVVLLVQLVQVALPLMYIRIGVAVALVGLGVYKLIRSRHFRWGGMQVGFRELTIWSFLMASAHGAGFMVLPFVMPAPAALSAAGHEHAAHMASTHTTVAAAGGLAVAIHTLAYLVVMALAAWVVYQKLGLSLLRTAWLNMDWLWAAALFVTGVVVLLK